MKIDWKLYFKKIWNPYKVVRCSRVPTLLPSPRTRSCIVEHSRPVGETSTILYRDSDAIQFWLFFINQSRKIRPVITLKLFCKTEKKHEHEKKHCTTKNQIKSFTSEKSSWFSRSNARHLFVNERNPSSSHLKHYGDNNNTRLIKNSE